MEPEFSAFEVLLQSWEAWAFTLVLVIYLCTLVDRSVIGQSIMFGKVGGWLLLFLFFFTYGIESDKTDSYFAVTVSMDDYSVERFIVDRSMMVLRIYLRFILLLFAAVWGWRYLNERSSRAKS